MAQADGTTVSTTASSTDGTTDSRAGRSTPPRAAPFRPVWRHPFLWRTVAAAVLVAVCLLGTRFVPPSEAEAILSGDSVDPVDYATGTYSDVVAYVEDNAVPLPELAADLEADEDTAAEQHGQRDGEAAYTYATTFTGTVGGGGFGTVSVQVDGMPQGVSVYVPTGPALTGTALRDVTGETTFDMFTNQIDYAQVGITLNEQVRDDVLAPADLASLGGRTVTVTGAFAYSDPQAITVMPVRIEVGS